MSCYFNPWWVRATAQESRIFLFAELNDRNARELERLERLTALLNDEEVEGE